MIIHQIWIGTKAAPEEWLSTVRQFCEQYGHTYRFWGNAEVSQIDFDKYPGLRDLMLEYETKEKQYKYAGQADILRNIILYENGGIYIDADCVIVNPERFDSFLRAYDGKIFYGWEDDKGLIANSVIGCPRGHVYMKRTLDVLPKYAAERRADPVWDRTGPGFITHMYAIYGPDYAEDIEIVPKGWFYPGGWHGLKRGDSHTNMQFPPEAMLFQYGYTTNNLGASGGGSGSGAGPVILQLGVVAALFALNWFFRRS